MSDAPSIMVKCACHGEAIEITHPTMDAGYSEDEFWISIWNQGFCRPLCMRERIRWCWNIFRTGKPWADNIILTPEQAKQIADFINQQNVKLTK
jgi:hypothetical protein